FMSMSTNTQIQMSVPDRLRGRVMSVYTTIFAGTTPIGRLIAGALASGFGTAVSIMVGGLVSVGIAATALVVAWRWGLIGSPRSRPEGGVLAGQPAASGMRGHLPDNAEGTEDRAFVGRSGA
ncbi:MAG TPA: hypothetical protein VIK13_06430, partial [Candidatus Limnocylindrales bacterium]